MCICHSQTCVPTYRQPASQDGDTAISHLLAAGLLCRDTQDPTLLHWTLPGVGAVVHAITAGVKVGVFGCGWVLLGVDGYC